MKKNYTKHNVLRLAESSESKFFEQYIYIYEHKRLYYVDDCIKEKLFSQMKNEYIAFHR